MLCRANSLAISSLKSRFFLSLDRKQGVFIKADFLKLLADSPEAILHVLHLSFVLLDIDKLSD